MQIFIDFKKIIESPYKKEYESSFIFNDNELIEQIANELNYSTSSCYLISGYRGVGKTSFIKKVESFKDKSKTLFFNINLSKYESHSLTLRKILREIYLQSKDSKVWNDNTISEINKKKVRTLFERTFNNISSIESFENIKENSSLFDFRFDLRKLILLIIAILSGANIYFNFLNINNFNQILFYIAIVVNLFFYFNWNKIISIKKIRQKKKLIESFYDDEIAEFHLINLIEDIKKNNVQLIFVIDELDKIMKNDIERLVSDLKPIILSGNSSFVFVAGQSLYYKVLKDLIKDDSVMSSIFSKVIHIPLMDISYLRKLFQGLVKKTSKDEINSEACKYFLDSIILESQKIPRKFINLIREKIIWKDANNAYIEFDENLLEAYKTDSTILTIIENIVDDDDFGNNHPSNKDFFSSQIFLWSKKIKLFKNYGEFKFENIYSVDDYQVDYYPSEYLLNLSGLCELLLENIVDSGLLEKKRKKVKNSYVYYYKWAENVDVISTDSPIDKNILGQSRFLNEFNEFENFIIQIFEGISEKDGYNFRRDSLKDKINFLIDKKILNRSWGRSKRLNDLIRLRNKLVHSEKLSLKDLDRAQEFKFFLNKSQRELFEDYMYYLLNGILESKGFRLLKGIEINRDVGVDFVAQYPEDLAEIFFEVKYINYTNRRIIFKLIDKIIYLLNKNVGSQFVVFVHLKRNIEYSEPLNDEMRYRIKEMYPELAHRIHIFYIQEFDFYKIEDNLNFVLRNSRR